MIKKYSYYIYITLAIGILSLLSPQAIAKQATAQNTSPDKHLILHLDGQKAHTLKIAKRPLLKVQRWHSKGSQKLDAMLIDQPPLYIKDKRVIRFNGQDQGLKLSKKHLQLGQTFSVYMVLKMAHPERQHKQDTLLATTQWSLQCHNHGQALHFLSQNTSEDTHTLTDNSNYTEDFIILRIDQNPDEKRIYKNGHLLAKEAVNLNDKGKNKTGFSIAADLSDDPSFLTADIAEIIIYTDPLSDDAHDKLIRRLSDKWDIRVKTKQFHGMRPKVTPVLWLDAADTSTLDWEEEYPIITWQSTTGRRHTARAIHQPTYSKVRKTINFNADGSYFSINDHPDFTFSEEDGMAIFMVVRIDEYHHGFETLIAKGDNSWRISRDGWGRGIDFATSGINGYYGDLYDKTNYEGSFIILHADLNHDQKRIFKNGMMMVQEFVQSGELQDNEYNVSIGENLQATGRFLNGEFGEIRIYNRELDKHAIRAITEELSQKWNIPLHKPPPLPTPNS